MKLYFRAGSNQEKDLKENITKVTMQEQKTTDAANIFRKSKKFKDAVHYGKGLSSLNTRVQGDGPRVGLLVRV